jgi:hypothetical protein
MEPKILVAGNTLEDQPNRRHTSNEISAPYEVPQYPIEQIESKLNRVKKEFDESSGQPVQAMGPNIKGSLTAAVSAAAGPAVEVAKSLSIQSSSIANADQIPPSKEVLDDFKDIQIKSENEIASVIRKISSQKQAWGTESTGLAVDPCIDVVEDVDIEKEEFIPHFQRVSVSGDDNTGVSIFLLI